MLAHNATLYEMPFDPFRLFTDPEYVEWFAIAVDSVGRTRERQQRDAEAKAKAT